MASSGTYAAAPDNADFIEEAFERCLIEPAKLTARHFRSASFSMNLLFAHWNTLGVKLFQVDEQTQLLTAADADYTAASGTLAILEGVIRRDGIDTPVTRMTREQYHLIPDKTSQGMPTQVWLDRATMTYYLWHVPENSTDVFRHRRVRRMQDAGTGQNTPDLPFWWHQALASGLAWFLSEKFAPDLYDKLGARAAKFVGDAIFEDRERGDTSFGDELLMRYAQGKHALGQCRRCGGQKALNELVMDGHTPGLLVCRSCRDERHPVEKPFRTDEGIALKRPAPNLDDDSLGGLHYLQLEGVAGEYASSPDSAAASVVGDLDLRARVALDSWGSGTDQMVFGKWTAAGNQRAYNLKVSSTGHILLATSPDGNSAGSLLFTSTLPAPVSARGLLSIRATLDADNEAGGKTARFYTSGNDAVWTPLGDAVTSAGVTSIFDSDAVCIIGQFIDGVQLVTGKVYSAEVRNGIDGPVVVKFDASAAAVGATSFESETGETWTLNGGAAIRPELLADLFTSRGEPYFGGGT